MTQFIRVYKQIPPYNLPMANISVILRMTILISCVEKTDSTSTELEASID
jgi:hypothetical protein